VDNSESLQSKLEHIETLVDALVEERNGLRADLRRIGSQVKTTGSTREAGRDTGDLLRSLDGLRTRLADSEASNQKLVRERNQIRERLTQIKDRLDQVEAKLLEQRSVAGNSRG
jgi:chromosome segregation ATPase